MVRPVAVDLADARRRGRPVGVPGLGEPAAGPGRATLIDPAILRNRLRSEAHRVLLPVHAAGRAVLRRAPVPVGGPRPVGDRHGVRLLPLSPSCWPRPGSPRPSPTPRRRVVQLGMLALFAGIVVMIAALDAGAGPRSSPGRCCSPASASGRWPPARQRHRVVGPRRAEQRGRRAPEHGHQPRRLDRHRAGRRDPDLHAHDLVPDRHRGEPRRPRRGRLRRRGRTLGRHPVRVRRRPRGALGGGGEATARPSSTRTPPASTRCASLSVLALLALVALFFTRGLP